MVIGMEAEVEVVGVEVTELLVVLVLVIRGVELFDVVGGWEAVVLALLLALPDALPDELPDELPEPVVDV